MSFKGILLFCVVYDWLSNILPLLFPNHLNCKNAKLSTTSTTSTTILQNPHPQSDFLMVADKINNMILVGKCKL